LHSRLWLDLDFRRGRPTLEKSLGHNRGIGRDSRSLGHNGAAALPFRLGDGVGSLLRQRIAEYSCVPIVLIGMAALARWELPLARLVPKSPDSPFHTQGEQEKNAPNQSSCVYHDTSLGPKRTSAGLNKSLDATKPFLAEAAITRPRTRF
jgi:hypothetical protein